MANETGIGSRLPLVVKSDLVREDLPGCTVESIWPVVDQAAGWRVPVYAVITDGERKVKLPVQSAGFDGHELRIYAEVRP